jgi:hypothetical protein
VCGVQAVAVAAAVAGRGGGSDCNWHTVLPGCLHVLPSSVFHAEAPLQKLAASVAKRGKKAGGRK